MDGATPARRVEIANTCVYASKVYGARDSWRAVLKSRILACTPSICCVGITRKPSADVHKKKGAPYHGAPVVVVQALVATSVADHAESEYSLHIVESTPSCDTSSANVPRSTI